MTKFIKILTSIISFSLLNIFSNNIYSSENIKNIDDDIHIDSIINENRYSLIDVYNFALQNDQQIRISYNNLKSSDYGRFTNLAPLLPQVIFSSEYQNGNQNLKFANIKINSRYNSRFFNFSLNQIVFNYALLESYKKSKYDYYNQEMRFNNAKQNLIIDVATKYFNIIKAKNNLISQEEEYKSIQSQYKQTDAQYKVGIVAKVDLDDVTAKLATSKTRVIISKTLVSNAVDELEVLTNKQITNIKNYDHKKEIYKYSLNNNDWLKKAIDQNFTIKQSLYNTLSKNTDVKIATSDFLPTISFSGAYLGQKFNPSDTNFVHTKTVMLNISYPLFSSGNTYFTRKQSLYLYNKAKHDYEQTYRQETTNVYIYIRNIETSLAQIKSLYQELKSQKTAVKAARAGYEAGTRTMTEVLEQLSSFYQAQTLYNNSFYDYFLNTLKLKQVVGELDFNDIMTIDSLLH